MSITRCRSPPAAIWWRGSAATAGCSTPRRATRDAEAIDVRTLALVRETLARHAGLADFAFAMQGLGAGPISLFGTPDAARSLAAEDAAAARPSPPSR